jgi:hypothetical protein
VGHLCALGLTSWAEGLSPAIDLVRYATPVYPGAGQV